MIEYLQKGVIVCVKHADVNLVKRAGRKLKMVRAAAAANHQGIAAVRNNNLFG